MEYFLKKSWSKPGLYFIKQSMLRNKVKASAKSNDGNWGSPTDWPIKGMISK